MGAALAPRVLITGGDGFLGRHLAHALAVTGAGVRVLDVAAPASGETLDGVEIVRGDVRDPEALMRALDGTGAVVHAAFAPPQSAPATIWSVNAGGTAALVEHALACGIARLVLVSSTIVTWPPRPHPLLPSSPLGRLDLYRRSCRAAEVLVARGEMRGLVPAVVRPRTFLGPGGVGAFALLFARIRDGRPVPMLGRGRHRHQLLDVRDLAAALAMLALGAARGTFTLGTERFGTVREDLQALIDHAGTGASLRALPAGPARAAARVLELAGLPPLSGWHASAARGEDTTSEPDPGLRALGWRPLRSNAEALIDAYDWFVRTPGARPTHPVPRSHRLLDLALRALG